MPKIEPDEHVIESDADLARALERQRQETRLQRWEDRRAWKISRKGNWYRNWHGAHVVVFEFDSGAWGWVARDYANNETFSPRNYSDFQSAAIALGRWLGVY